MSFSGLNIGLSSLYAQRRGLEVAGQNLANANTEGYSRQRVSLQSDAGPVLPAVWSRWSGAGSGVDVAGVARMRDNFLEARGVQERGNEASLRSRETSLSRIEAMLGEPGKTGLQAQLSEFWSGWDDVANQPNDLAARSQLLERATTVADGLNRVATQLDQQWTGSRDQLLATVTQINATAANVAELNKTIASATTAGLSPNDLSDQRDLLVGRLADMAGVTIRTGEAGTVDVYLQGNALVRGSQTEALSVRGATGLARPAGTVSVVWASDGRAAAAAGGQVGGLLTALNDIVPRYRDDLDQVAGSLRNIVNTGQQAGFLEDGTAGQAFFSGTTASDLEVALTGPAQVAASSSAAGGRDGANALAMAEHGSDVGGADRLYRGLVVRLGVETQTATRRVEIQSVITAQVGAAREAESGVNLDEEMVSMLAYQRAYEGAARFVTAVDQMLDTLINRTGVVGR